MSLTPVTYLRPSGIPHPLRRRKRGLGAVSPSTSQIQQMIIAAANSAGLPPALALGVANHESAFNPNANNCSSGTPLNANGTCDYGVMQINETNLAAYGLTNNPLDPQGNINAGVSMLKQLWTKYNGNEDQVLCAYQYGSGPCGNPNSLPSLTPGYVAAVNSWIANNADSLGVDSSLGTSPIPTDSSGTDLTDAGSLLGGLDTTTVVVAVVALLGLAFLLS